MRLLLCLLLAVVAGPAWAGAVLVMNSGEATLSVIDMASRKEVRRIPVLREPHHVVPTPDGKDLLVGDTVANEIYDLDPATFELRRRIAAADPYQIGFSPDGRLFVVNGLARAQVDVHDGATFKLIKRFPLKSMPSHMAFSPDSATVFVSLQGTDKLAAIDLKAMAVRWIAETGAAPAGVLWNRGRVLVANMGSDDVWVIDPATGKTERKIHTGKGAHQLFPSPDGKLIYVNNRVDGTSVVLDGTTLNQVRSYKLPGGPDDIAFAPDGHVWFTLRFVHKVAVLDPASGTYETIDVGRSPHGIWLDANAVAK
jgi:YVTN family beta-propeller protein